MNNFSSPFGLPDDAPALAKRFALILAGLGALVARRFLRMPHLVGLTVLLWSRLNRAVQRFHRALTRPAIVPASRAPRVRADHADAARARPGGLPRGRGWLVRELGWEAAAFMAQLEALLAELETRAVLARTPAAGRILRPICRMLGVVVPEEMAPAPARISVEEVRLEPVGAPGLSTDCEAFATSAW